MEINFNTIKTDSISAWLGASAAKQMRTALLWVIKQRIVVIYYRRFGTVYQSHFQDSILKMEPIEITTTRCLKTQKSAVLILYTGCPRRNVPDFGRVFLMLKYTDITQNASVQSWTVTEIMTREVWNFDSCYTLIDYQIHIKTGRNMWFL